VRLKLTAPAAMHIEPYGFLKGMPIVRLGGIANLEWAVLGRGLGKKRGGEGLGFC